MLNNRIINNVFALSILQVVNYIGPLFALLYLTKILDINHYGAVAFCIGIVQFCVVLTDFGFGLSATKSISKRRENKIYVGKLIGSILIFKFILFLIASMVICSIPHFSPKYYEYRTLFYLSTIQILGQGFQVDWFYLGIEKMKFITFFTIVARFLSIIALILFVNDTSDYYLVPVANGLAQVVAALLFIWNIYKCGYFISLPEKLRVYKVISDAWYYFLSRISVLLYSNGSIVLLGFLYTTSYIAVFSIADQVYKVFQTVVSPISQALFPYMVKERNIVLMFRIILYSTLSAILVSLLAFFVVPYFIIYWFSESWHQAIPIINIFLIAVPVHVLNTMSGYPLASVLGIERYANISVVLGLIIFSISVSILFYLDMVTMVSLAYTILLIEVAVTLFRIVKIYPKAIDYYKMMKYE